MGKILPPPGSIRTLAVITLTLTLGQGLWLALNAIYTTTVLRLTPGQFGIGVGLAAGFALAASTPTGHLADRVGPRTVQIWSFVALAPLSAALLYVHGMTEYVVAACAQAVAYSASRSARMAMIAGLVPPSERVYVRSYVRAVSNAGVAISAGAAGVLLSVGTATVYRAAVAFIAVVYLATGLMTVLLPAVPAQPRRAGPTLVVLRDRPYLVLMVLDGLLSMHNLLLDVVLPLWVLHRTHAPRWMIAVVVLTNTLLVVVLQVKVARGTDEPGPAARAERSGALCLGIACLIFALSQGVSAPLACTLLVLGAVVHVLGEIRQAAGSWGISFGLAPDDAQGQYQGTYAMGADIGKMIAPAVLTWLAIDHGRAGWIAMAVGFAALGALVPPVVGWAQRKRRAAAPAVA